MMVKEIVMTMVFFSFNSYAQDSLNEIKNFSFECFNDAHGYSFRSLEDSKLNLEDIFDFRIWQMVQRNLGFEHVPPDMHDSSITILQGQETAGKCEANDSKININCSFNTPVTALLSGRANRQFKILGVRTFIDDLKVVHLELSFSSMDGTKSGKASTWSGKHEDCRLIEF